MSNPISYGPLIPLDWQASRAVAPAVAPTYQNLAHLPVKGYRTPVQNGEGAITKVPPEIISEIFSHLDLASIGQATQVCRLWRVLINDNSSLWKRLFIASGFPRYNSTLSSRECLRQWRTGTIYSEKESTTLPFQPHFLSVFPDNRLILGNYREKGFFITDADHTQIQQLTTRGFNQIQKTSAVSDSSVISQSGKSLHLWDLQNHSVRNLTTLSSSFALLSADLLATLYNNRVTLLKISSGKMSGVLELPSEENYSDLRAQSATQLFIRSMEAIMIWDITELTPRATISLFQLFMPKFTIIDSSTYLQSSSENDGSTHTLFNIDTQASRVLFSSTSDAKHTIALNLNPNILLTVCRDGATRVDHLKTGYSRNIFLNTKFLSAQVTCDGDLFGVELRSAAIHRIRSNLA